MRKNQKYSQEVMFKAIEHCRKEQLTYTEFSKQTGIPYHCLKYWENKYQQKFTTKQEKTDSRFIPMQVISEEFHLEKTFIPENIIITWPNGTKIECPVKISPDLLEVILKSS